MLNMAYIQDKILIIYCKQFLRNTLFQNGPGCTKPSHIKLPIFDKTNFKGPKFQIINQLEKNSLSYKCLAYWFMYMKPFLLDAAPS